MNTLGRFHPFETEALAGIAVSTLVVAASAHLLAPDAAELAAGIPGPKLLALHGVGHAAMLEAPEDLILGLLQHLEAMEGGRHG